MKGVVGESDRAGLKPRCGLKPAPQRGLADSLGSGRGEGKSVEFSG